MHRVMWFGIHPGTGAITQAGGAPGGPGTGISIMDTITTDIITIMVGTDERTIIITPVGMGFITATGEHFL